MDKKRIVVKIGSSSLTNDKGEIDERKLADHVGALAALRHANHEVIMVSSGAVAAGFAKLGYSSRPVTLKGKQAAAAVGQSLLIGKYMDNFGEYNITSAQLLLTRGDFSNRNRFKNAYATMIELLERGIVPIINENDTVSVEELTFGDNDMLSALVSGFIHADQLIILTDINGIYSGDPRTDRAAEKFDHLEGITDELIAAADTSGSKVGTGGMKSKLMAARTAISLGVPVFIGIGDGNGKLLEILNGRGNGTYISSIPNTTINTRRQWIAFHSESMGKIYVDKGAEEAILYQGGSLLSPGVSNVIGTFQTGDVVEVYGSHRLLGKGQVSCSSEELTALVNSRMGNEKVILLPSIDIASPGSSASPDSASPNSPSPNSPTIEVIHRHGWARAIQKGGDLSE
ncbi:glutamate 5-kinase [Oceanobacillus massiliensis]|uniref:glutamate 5-kinase n=1 Tax=Oceanobacillus massiliensis TaxID=1465765 RepID=UPI00028A1346|nr:glutamate 5-kinase [Oceanobacillus massiliensis]